MGLITVSIMIGVGAGIVIFVIALYRSGGSVPHDHTRPTSAEHCDTHTTMDHTASPPPLSGLTPRVTHKDPKQKPGDNY